MSDCKVLLDPDPAQSSRGEYYKAHGPTTTLLLLSTTLYYYQLAVYSWSDGNKFTVKPPVEQITPNFQDKVL